MWRSYGERNEGASFRLNGYVTRERDYYYSSNSTAKVKSQVIHLKGTIKNISFSGREAQIHVKLIDGNQLVAHITRPGERLLDEIGKTVQLELSHKSIMFFNNKSGLRR